MPFTTPSKNSSFIRGLLKEEKNPVVAEMIRYADRTMIPVLLPESAVFLEQMLFLNQPAQILEVGTALGYSAQLMLRNCAGHLTTIEIDENYARLARRNLDELGYLGRYTLFVGDAGEILPFMDGEYDFIFMDGPKTHYRAYPTQLKRTLKACGIIWSSNDLFNETLSGGENLQHRNLPIVKAFSKEL